MKRTDDNGPFSLMTNFPKKVFTEEEYGKRLEDLSNALLYFLHEFKNCFLN